MSTSISLNNILCPIDFSDYSLHALDYAIGLSEQYKSVIHVLHVVPVLPLSHTPYHYHENANLVVESAEKCAKEELDKVCKDKIPKGISYKTILLLEEAPAIAISTYAKDNEIDLIVIATHGYGEIKHFFLGSITERVIRKANCPVLTVKDKEHEFITVIKD